MSENNSSNADFSDLRSLYERKENTSKLGDKDGGVKFLKIRSLKKNHLRNLLSDSGQNLNGDEGIWELRKQAYGTSVSVDQIDALIRNEFEGGRIANRDQLKEGVKNLPSLGSSVHRDDINSTVKSVVRDKSLDSIEKLEEKIETETLPRVKSYIMWSWYNQNTNDLLEEVVYEHQKVLPTLRKVHGIDFFLKTKNKDVPLDLKLSYIPQSYFDKVREEEEKETEERVVKEFFKQKSETIGGRGLVELANHIRDNPRLFNSGGKELLEGLLEDRGEIIENLLENPEPLCNWLYHDQFPRLFNNNNRFFIILADKNSFEKPWEIKANVDEIGDIVQSHLDEFGEDGLITVNYEYDKSEQHRGKYKSKCGIVLIPKSRVESHESDDPIDSNNNQMSWDEYSSN